MSKDKTPSGRIRNYAKEAKQHATPSSTADRVDRNYARRQLEKAGKVHKGDGKDVDHKDGDPNNRNPMDWNVLVRKKNQQKQ